MIEGWPPDGMDTSSEALWWLCAETAAALTDAGLKERVEAVRERLGEPLRLAVAGAVSAGKSTLVNALLRRPVAPVDAGECTKMVAWYTYDAEQDGRVDVELHDGRIMSKQLTVDGRLPVDVGVPADDVRRMVVYLDEPALRRLTLIDTPGMNTTTRDNEERTRRLLFGERRAGEVQAMLYVLRYTQRFDAGTLGEFRDMFDAAGLSAVNTVALLSHIDMRIEDADPWPRAKVLASRAYDQLSSVVFDVAPVIGLVAEAARTGAITDADLAALKEIAQADELDFEDAVLSVDDFLASPDLSPSKEQRRRLVELVHLYGVQVSRLVLRDQPDLDVRGLSDRLAVLSGFSRAAGADDSTRVVDDAIAHFARSAGQLKAFGAIAELRRLARTPNPDPADKSVLAKLGDALDEGRRVSAGLAGLRLLTAFDAARRDVLRLGPEQRASLELLVRGGSLAAKLGLPADAGRDEVAAAAARASIDWRRVAMTAGGSAAGARARDVLDFLEEVAGQVPPLGPVEVPRAVEGATTLSGLAEEDRHAIRALSADTLAGQVQASPDAPAELIAARAAKLAGRFRARAQTFPPAGGRRAMGALCDVFEDIWATASARTGGT